MPRTHLLVAIAISLSCACAQQASTDHWTGGQAGAYPDMGGAADGGAQPDDLGAQPDDPGAQSDNPGAQPDTDGSETEAAPELRAEEPDLTLDDGFSALMTAE